MNTCMCAPFVEQRIWCGQKGSNYLRLFCCLCVCAWKKDSECVRMGVYLWYVCECVHECACACAHVCGWIVHMRAMTVWYGCHDSIVCVPWFIPTCAMSHSYVCICVLTCTHDQHDMHTSCSVLQCVAMCCNELQYVAVRCSVLQCVAECSRVLQCVAMRCNALQCVTVCCSALQCVAACLL